MPVLDAKALKVDPEGAAFLLSVLRRPGASRLDDKASPQDGAEPARPSVRVLTRLRELMPDVP